MSSAGELERKLRELLSSDQLSNLIQKKAEQDQINERKAATFLLGMFSANENRPPEPINIAQCAQAFVTEFNNPSKHTSIETFLKAQIQEIKAIAHPGQQTKVVNKNPIHYLMPWSLIGENQ